MPVPSRITSQPPRFETLEDTVSLNRYTHEAVSLPFMVLPGIFQPDEWTAGTLEATCLALDRFPSLSRILDIGSGSGIIPLVLSRLYADRGLALNCCDLKPEAGRNLALNYAVFGGDGPRPLFHQIDILDPGPLPGENIPPDLVVANIPQLPAAPSNHATNGDWNPDDYHAVWPKDRENPIRAFGMGLLMDVIGRVSAVHPGRFAVAFCQSSRVPPAVFDSMLSRTGGRVLYSGDPVLVRDGSTPFHDLADAEERFGLSGSYIWQGRKVCAKDLRHLTPETAQVEIELRSCLLEIG